MSEVSDWLVPASIIGVLGTLVSWYQYRLAKLKFFSELFEARMHALEITIEHVKLMSAVTGRVCGGGDKFEYYEALGLDGEASLRLDVLFEPDVVQHYNKAMDCCHEAVNGKPNDVAVHLTNVQLALIDLRASAKRYLYVGNVNRPKTLKERFSRMPNKFFKPDDKEADVLRMLKRPTVSGTE